MDATATTAGDDSPIDADAVWDPLEAGGDPFGEPVAEAVETARSGVPVAVVGAPFGGREHVLRRVAADLDTPPALDEPTVLAGAHHCHTREIGGFDRLETLFERAATTDAPVVTGWNAFAWEYCHQARAVGRQFDPVHVPALERAEIATLVDAWAPGVTFRAPPVEGPGLLSVERRSVAVPGAGPVSLPVPRLHTDALAARPADDDPEPAVVRQLTDLSDGNPGVARALWTNCVADDEVSPGDLRTPVTAAREADRERAQRRPGDSGPGTPRGTDTGEAALDRYDAVCLRVVLAGESLPRSAVAAALGPVARDVDAVLARLERQGYLTAGQRVTLRPAAVPDAVTLTERRGIP